MGVIKEGRVSGTLPDVESFAVHYPGYPKSTARAVHTLGGTEGILKARSSPSNVLELHFRPEDPYSHPVSGKHLNCKNLLLKISKKKCSSGQTSEASGNLQESSTSGATDSQNPKQTSQVEVQRPEEDQTDLCADIVSRVTGAYHFDGLVDYQHVVAVHADAARKRKRNWVEAEEPPYEKREFMDVDQEDVMMILPPLFSIKDMPYDMVLKPSTISSSKKKQEGVVQYSSEGDLEPGLAIDFNIKDIPKKVNWEKLITPGSEQWDWQVTVSKLFDERPIWPKESIAACLLEKGLESRHLNLKRLLLMVAYYFSYGPFLRFWIKRGYDPRKDPESRIYQRTEFRVPEPLRSYMDANVPNKLKHKWGDLCSFRVFPYKCQTFLQLFELDDDYIQEEIRKPPKLATCNFWTEHVKDYLLDSLQPKTGWFSECVLDCLRLRVAVRFFSVYPGTGAESILKSQSEEFEKLKRSCILNSRQEEYQQTNRGDADKERPKSFDDEEDEIETDEEEELDVYDTLNLGGEDDEISLQPDTYLDMENNSRIYLQELFGSFPSAVPGADAIQAADTSDGEYQIYEQLSDDNYSDDDDDDG